MGNVLTSVLCRFIVMGDVSCVRAIVRSSVLLDAFREFADSRNDQHENAGGEID